LTIVPVTLARVIVVSNGSTSVSVNVLLDSRLVFGIVSTMTLLLSGSVS